MKPRIVPTSLLPACALLAALVLASLPSARSADDVKQVTITANDALKFDVTEIVATPGEKIHVMLKNIGTLPKDGMGHDWILLDSEAEANTYAMCALPDRAEGYEPKSQAKHVLASIPLLGPKEVGEITFLAPTKPGKYPYICSCSGHSMAGMKGMLIVK